MKLGFLQVYNEINWISYAIDQALSFCDKLIICEGSQFVGNKDIPERSTDGTLNIINAKIKQYPNRIILKSTNRESKNYRQNQCNNFNHALTYCNIGDYFIQLDADVFFFENSLSRVSKMMDNKEFDIFYFFERRFGWGFKWEISLGQELPYPTIIRKTRHLKFIPTHQIVGEGEIQKYDIGVNMFHYTWVKPKERILLRARTSGMHPGVYEWVKKNWDTMELSDGKQYKQWNNKLITIKRYEGHHPSILDNHPWRYVEDIRKLNC